MLSVNKNQSKFLLAFLNLFSWVKLISSLRVFEIVRMFLHMIIDIISSLGSFYFFFGFVMLAFATTYTILMSGNDYNDAINIANYSYIMYEYIF
jgi:hypothetical protein